MDKFSALFQPGKIGTLQLDNRLIMAAMGTSLVDGQGGPSESAFAFYRLRARGGVGLLTTQSASVSEDACPFYELGAYDDKFIPGLKSIFDVIHEEGGKACLQLMHFGMLITFAGFLQPGLVIKVPSITTWMTGDRPFEAVTVEAIDGYVEDFAQAARRAKEAGVDAIELHMCHGCLVGSFLTPVMNRRTDEYGGSVENRLRFPLRIMERVRAEVGADFPIIVKIDGDNDVEGGVTLDEVVLQAQAMEGAGADAINISSGIEFWSSKSIPCFAYPEGPSLALASKVKQAVKVPMITAGKISVELAEKVIADGTLDFVSMGRPMLTDPELPNKLREGRVDDIRRCIYCNNCIRTDPGPFCTVNPFMYQEEKLPLPPAETPKKVVVVGGGIAGMQAAALLAERGHSVELYEKGDELGGQWRVVTAASGKGDFGNFTAYLKRAIDKAGVSVNLGAEVTKEMVLEAKPDAVVIATGATPLVLNVPGIERDGMVQANDVIMGKAEVKGKVVVIGGRFIGMEVALALAEEGKEVSIVTKAGLGENGHKLERMIYRFLTRQLIDMRVPVYSHAPVLEFTKDSVVVLWGDEIFALPADTVVLAVGARADNALAQELKGEVPELYTIGDCEKPRDAAAATLEAAKVAARI